MTNFLSSHNRNSRTFFLLGHAMTQFVPFTACGHSSRHLRLNQCCPMTFFIISGPVFKRLKLILRSNVAPESIYGKLYDQLFSRAFSFAISATWKFKRVFFLNRKGRKVGFLRSIRDKATYRGSGEMSATKLRSIVRGLGFAYLLKYQPQLAFSPEILLPSEISKCIGHSCRHT